MLYLKERRQIALHVACGDITDVELGQGKLIINVYDGMLLNLLYSGKRDIESAIRWQGLEMDLEIRVKEMESSVSQRDIKRLQEVFEEVTVLNKKIEKF